ncbi:MAG: hypothetical protein AAF585_22925, partial [Verrucomicrobiota bacterium]
MKSRLQRCIAVSLFVIVVLVSWIGWALNSGSPLYASATRERDKRPDVPLSESLLIDLGDGQAIRVVGFAITIPGQAELRWRHPQTAELLDSLQLQAAPERVLESPIATRAPILSILLKAEGELEIAHCVETRVRDDRTNANVLSFAPWRGPRHTEVADGRWAHIQAPIVIWHDSPLFVELDIRHGNLKRTELIAKNDSRAAWSGNLGSNRIEVPVPNTNGKVEFLHDGSIRLGYASSYNSGRRGWFTFDGRVDAAEPGRHLVARVTNQQSELRGFCLEFELEHGAIRRSWWMAPEIEVGQFVGIRRKKPPPLKTAEHALIIQNAPHPSDCQNITGLSLDRETTVAIRIPVLPEMPNGRELDNLLDARIPLVEANKHELHSIASNGAELTAMGFLESSPPRIISFGSWSSN